MDERKGICTKWPLRKYVEWMQPTSYIYKWEAVWWSFGIIDLDLNN